jgi:hypothetical protein
MSLRVLPTKVMSGNSVKIVIDATKSGNCFKKMDQTASLVKNVKLQLEMQNSKNLELIVRK